MQLTCLDSACHSPMLACKLHQTVNAYLLTLVTILTLFLTSHVLRVLCHLPAIYYWESPHSHLCSVSNKLNPLICNANDCHLARKSISLRKISLKLKTTLNCNYVVIYSSVLMRDLIWEKLIPKCTIRGFPFIFRYLATLVL